MANRFRSLDELAVRSECRTSWEQMKGTGSRRFCDECRREVFDFAQLSAAEIRDQLQARRGALCARLTWRGGSLVVAREPTLAASTAPRVPRRASVIATGLVTAWLGTGGGTAAAQAPEPASGVADVALPAGQAEAEQAPSQPATSPSGAALRGRVNATGQGRPLGRVTIVARNVLDGHETTARTETDGTFFVTPLRAGIYEVEGSAAGFSIAAETVALQAGEERQIELQAQALSEETATLGAIVAPSVRLRQAFEMSETVVAATVGRSVVVSRKDDLVEMLTDLHVESALKGTLPGRDLTYRHAEYDPVDGEPTSSGDEVAPGDHVLAFLQRSNPGSDGDAQPTFETVAALGLQRLDGGEQAAYTSRLEALAGIERQAERRGEMSPADLLEWIVATVEEPLTRGEVINDLVSALDALWARAAEAGTSTRVAGADLQRLLTSFRHEGGKVLNEPPRELLAALLTRGQEERLTAALRSSESLESGHELFRVVVPWDRRAATRWLLDQLRKPMPPAAEVQHQVWALVGLAEYLGDGALHALAETALEQQEEIGAGSDDESPQARSLRQEKVAGLVRALRRDFAAALASKR